MTSGFKTAGVCPNMPGVDTCLVFIPEVLASPLDSTVMTFILVLTFLNLTSESNHYILILGLLRAAKLLPKNEIVILFRDIGHYCIFMHFVFVLNVLYYFTQFYP